jgi:type IV pilus assembly protein PilN
MIRINLLPVRAARKRGGGKRSSCSSRARSSSSSSVTSGGATAGERLSKGQAKLARTKAEIAQLEKIIGEVKNIRDQQSALKDKLAVLDKLKAGRQGPVRMLDELATIIPKRVWLRKVDEKGGAVTMEASAATIDDVSAFLTALKKARYFANPELKKTSAKNEGKFKMVEFTVVVSVNYTPGVEVAAAVAPSTPAGKR